MHRARRAGGKEPRTTSLREHEALLRRLAVNDEAAIEALLGVGLSDADPCALGVRTTALIRLAGLVATDAPRASYQWGVGVALAAGASEDEIVDVLRVLAPIVGAARVNAAAAELGIALGYDMDASA